MIGLHVEGEPYSGKAKNGFVKYSPPASELLFFSVALGSFLLVFSFFLVVGFPFSLVCAIPIYGMIGALISIWSNSVLSIDLEEDKIVLRQSLVFTPGIVWRSETRPLSELTGIKLGVNRATRDIKDEEYYEDKREYERAKSEFNWLKREIPPPKAKTRTADWWKVTLTGSDNSLNDWEMDISSVALGGSNKVPDKLLITKLCSLLGLPELNLDHFPKKQNILLMFFFIGILVSPAIVHVANDYFFQLGTTAILPYMFLPMILAFTSFSAYIILALLSIFWDSRKRNIAIRYLDLDGNGLISVKEFESFKQRYFTGLEEWNKKLDAMFAVRPSDDDGNISLDEFVDLVNYVFILLNDRSKPPSLVELTEGWVEGNEQIVLREHLLNLTLDSPDDTIGNIMLREMS